MEIRVKDVGDSRQKIKQSRKPGMEAEVDLYPVERSSSSDGASEWKKVQDYIRRAASRPVKVGALL